MAPAACIFGRSRGPKIIASGSEREREIPRARSRTSPGNFAKGFSSRRVCKHAKVSRHFRGALVRKLHAFIGKLLLVVVIIM